MEIPDDVYEHIFSFLTPKYCLSTISLVCTHFNKLARKVDILDLTELNITDIALEKLLSKQWPNLHTLILQNCSKLEKPRIKHSNLQKIDVTFETNLTNESVEYLLENCPNLRELSIESLQTNIQIRHSKLQKLTLGYCDIKDVDVAFLINNCIALKELSFEGCEMLKNPRIEHQTLERVKFENTSIFNKTLEFLTRRCPKLLSLTIIDCPNITKLLIQSNSLISLSITSTPIQEIDSGISQCPNLTSLNLDNCKRITTESMKNISHQKLESCFINNSGVTPQIAEQINHQCPRLNQLIFKTRSTFTAM